MQTMDKMHLEKCLAMGLYLIITGNQPLYNSLKTKKKKQGMKPQYLGHNQSQKIRFYTFMTLAHSKTAEVRLVLFISGSGQHQIREKPVRGAQTNRKLDGRRHQRFCE